MCQITTRIIIRPIGNIFSTEFFARYARWVYTGMMARYATTEDLIGCIVCPYKFVKADLISIYHHSNDELSSTYYYCPNCKTALFEEPDMLYEVI